MALQIKGQKVVSSRIYPTTAKTVSSTQLGVSEFATDKRPSSGVSNRARFTMGSRPTGTTPLERTARVIIP